jgi:protein phosphatase
MLTFDAAVVSNVGPRPDNQDSAVIGPRLVAVADGVGGNVGGAVASSLVAGWLVPLSASRTHVEPGAEGLLGVITGANERLAAAVSLTPRLRTMATTLVTVLLDETGCTVGHIGDSRVYLLRDGRLSQVTSDHSLVQALIDAGQLTPAQAAVHPQRSVVYAALHGDVDDRTSVDLITVDVREGDRFLLCSDGLSDVVPADRLEAVLAGADTPQAAAKALVETALGAPAHDNVTVVVGDVREPPGGRPAPVRTVGAAASLRQETAAALEALWPASRVPDLQQDRVTQITEPLGPPPLA